jgi:3-phosphoshikimate 1-carboxyvinyltransferase
MNLICEQAELNGMVVVPGSKSHTIRAVAISALAEGQSQISRPLESQDTHSAAEAYRILGADVEMFEGKWQVTGFGGNPRPRADIIDVGNSGTTLNVALGSAALIESGEITLTGDEQIQRRPSGALVNCLNDLGAHVVSSRGNGCAPFRVSGRLRGGQTRLEAVSSQYLTSLLINAPLASADTVIHVPVLHERPYVWMTLDWLRRQEISLAHDEALTEFRIPGGQKYRAFKRAIPGDFSSATFFLAAGALPGNDVTCHGLDMEDTQGDRAVIDYLRALGAEVQSGPDWVRVRGGDLHGAELDLNATPDALPMMAALACFAHGTTRLVNVPQARIKETDRIKVMREELTRLGAHVEELPDGLVVAESPLRGARVNGHGDHRVVMSLAVAASAIQGETWIEGYEAASVTVPGFAELMKSLGAKARFAA